MKILVIAAHPDDEILGCGGTMVRHLQNGEEVHVAILAEGMTLTPEPKIESVDGLVNPEEHVVIRADGCEILSTDPGWELLVIE